MQAPYSIGDIAPVLKVFEIGQSMTLDHGVTPSDGVDRLTRDGFLITFQVIFIVHGFRNDVDVKWMHTMKDAILQDGNKYATVILVGWGKGANLNPVHYPQAASNTQVVGEWLAKYVNALRVRYRWYLYIWGIGHSLGAHLLAKAGRDSGTFNRITGLDPAGPSFERVNQDKRLDLDAADFVDVIHTDGYENLFKPVDWFSPVNHYGTLIPCGTIDFYPNYGYDQPGCNNPVYGSIGGSHSRAIDLFIWSIANPGKFETNTVLARTPTYRDPVTNTILRAQSAEMGYYANRFDVEMGYYPELSHRGDYYLKTNAAEPWAPVEQQYHGRNDEL